MHKFSVSYLGRWNLVRVHASKLFILFLLLPCPLSHHCLPVRLILSFADKIQLHGMVEDNTQGVSCQRGKEAGGGLLRATEDTGRDAG